MCFGIGKAITLRSSGSFDAIMQSELVVACPAEAVLSPDQRMIPKPLQARSDKSMHFLSSYISSVLFAP